VDQRLKDEAKTAAVPVLTVFGKWLLTRPRIAEVLKKLGIK
jgi:hypothetical protein